MIAKMNLRLCNEKGTAYLSESRFTGIYIKKERLELSLSQIVHPWGVEPQSMEPESIILSIELWVHPFSGHKNTIYKYSILIFPGKNIKFYY